MNLLKILFPTMLTVLSSAPANCQEPKTKPPLAFQVLKEAYTGWKMVRPDPDAEKESDEKDAK